MPYDAGTPFHADETNKPDIRPHLPRTRPFILLSDRMVCKHAPSFLRCCLYRNNCRDNYEFNRNFMERDTHAGCDFRQWHEHDDE